MHPQQCGLDKGEGWKGRQRGTSKTEARVGRKHSPLRPLSRRRFTVLSSERVRTGRFSRHQRLHSSPSGPHPYTNQRNPSSHWARVKEHGAGIVRRVTCDAEAVSPPPPAKWGPNGLWQLCCW